MGDIYRYGAINIAATGFSNGLKGFFPPQVSSGNLPLGLELERDRSIVYPDGSIERVLTQGRYLLADLDVWERQVEGAPLLKRGWVVQERALSPRTIHFGAEQMFWECLELRASEVFTEGFAATSSPREPKSLISPGEPLAWYDFDHKSETQPVVAFGSAEISWSGVRLTPSEDSLKSQCHCSTLHSLGNPEQQTSMLALLHSWLAEGYWDESFHPGKYSLSCPSQIPNVLSNVEHNTGVIKRLKLFKKRLRTTVLQSAVSGTHTSPPTPYTGMTQRQQQWLTVLEAYSGCNLTFSKDKLIAISGIARMMKEEMRCEYLAGLWRNDLEHQLLWSVVQPSKLRRPRKPSWSWISLDEPVQIGRWKWETGE